MYAKTHQLSAMSADTDWTNDIFSSVITTIDRLGKELLCKSIYKIGCSLACTVNSYLFTLDLHVHVLVFSVPLLGDTSMSQIIKVFFRS